VSGPRAGLDHPQCGGDELLNIAQVLLSLLTPLIDLAVSVHQFGKQLISRRVCVKGLDASLRDRPAADLGHPANRGSVTGMEPDRAGVTRQATIVDAQFLGSQLDPAAKLFVHLPLRYLRPGVAQDLHGRLDEYRPPDSLLSHNGLLSPQRAGWRGPRPGSGSRIVWYGTPVRIASDILS
jgi:hypothetical protein